MLSATTRHVAILLVVCMTMVAGCSKNTVGSSPTSTSTSTSTTVAPIPTKYQSLYDNLSSSLNAYQSAIDAMPTSTGSTTHVVAAAELLPANGNRLDQLLAPSTMAGVDAWLDKFRALGITGVTIGIKVPMLLASFGPKSEAYASFFTTVADHARSRGMTIDVELGALFCNTVFATCAKSSDGTYANLVSDTVSQARIVIDRVHPDYMTILAEPTTEATLTGVQELLSPQGSARYVHDVLAGIGDRGTTKVGAGAASWMDSSYDQAILGESVDYLDIHTYPMNAQIAATIVSDTALAQKARIPIVADEYGLYKTDNNVGSDAATSDAVYRLDNFSFFEPLDIRFWTITAEWAKKAGVAYVSLFWGGELFSYLTWTPQLDVLPYQALTQQANQAITSAFLAGHLTDFGRAFLSVFEVSSAHQPT